MVEKPSKVNNLPKVLGGPQLLQRLIKWEDYHEACAIDFTINGNRQKYSYQDVAACVESLAAQIWGVLDGQKNEAGSPQAQHIVPILLPQSPSLYISQLAILESGGAFCPINLDSPKDRIKFVIGDVAAGLIITTPEFRDVVSWEGGPTIILVDEFPSIQHEARNTQHISRVTSPHDLAYVMYTSGSSGTPKGVAVSHLAVSQSLLAHHKHLPCFQRFLQFAAPSFDVSVFEIFFPLTRGSTLVGCGRNQLLNDLPEVINSLEIDAAELTPTVAGSLLQKRSNVPGLKLLLTIGEMLTRPIIEEFGGSETKESILYGMYGPTEAAIHCTIHPKMRANAKPGNIGFPFDTVSTFVAAASESVGERDIKFLPIGELGELVLGGPQLAEGYLNREEQNKAAFIKTSESSYYRTGDRARLLGDGTIEILGRISAGQVKLRGQRVELGEIEDAVYKHPGIKTVSAMVLGSVLVVFALISDWNIKPETVLETCSKWLPKFMMPNEIVLLQNFPYLPSGKVDKSTLELDFQNQREHDESEAVSRSPIEQTVWMTLTGLLGHFPPSMRLASAGLDSLIAIRVASNLRVSGFNVSTISVLQADTLKSLVNLCKNSSSTPAVQPRMELQAKPGIGMTDVLNGDAKNVENIMPCTPLQSAMLAETEVKKTAYRNWVEIDLPGITNLRQIRSALDKLAEYNQILRTGFIESQDLDGYVQIVWNTLAKSQVSEVSELVYTFDESKDTSIHRPLRIQILLLDSYSKLLIHIHHALYDAWSLELLLDDLDILLIGEEPLSRPPFSDIVDGYLDGSLYTDSWTLKGYWKDHLSLLVPRTIPRFYSGKPESPGLAVTWHCTSISTRDVEIAAKRMSSSPQSLFQAAYALILSSYLGSPDVCFGTVFSGRTLPIVGIEEICGPCLSTLPIRVDISTSTTFRDLVEELNSTNRKHLQRSTLPLREIKAASGIHPRQSLFDTLLIWQQTLHPYDQARKYTSLVDTFDNLEFSLTLEIIPGVGNVDLKANYQQSVFPKSQVEILLRQVEQLCIIIIQNEGTTLEKSFSHLDHEVLSIENPTPDISIGPETLCSPVERVAAEDPDRPAISFAREVDSEVTDIQNISYINLNKRANQMGHYMMQTYSVLPEDIICIFMDKCCDLYISILATAKSGTAYLPLTPDIPPERLEYIIHEASVKVVMAQSCSRGLLKRFTMIQVVYVDEVDFGLFSSENIAQRSGPESLSYCIFTSGSTGTPKGVMVTWASLLSNLEVLENLYPATKESRLLQSCSQVFDVSVFEIFFTWRVGGCLCSAVKDVLFKDIENFIRVMDVTHLSLTPTVASLIQPENVPKVKFLVAAGEAITQRVFDTWADKGLYNGYGPSEMTNVCTVNPRISKYDSMNNIGAPLKTTSVFVLSPTSDFALVPRGGEGELCFGGSQVFRGYMDRNQDLGKIIDHPEFGRLYRSGDFGRLMPDGSLAYIGRKDDQVKLRGQRVELGEIDNIMLQSPEVRDCITMVTDGRNATQNLVCFWTSLSANYTTLECVVPDCRLLQNLYGKLKAALPGYMVPSALIPVSHLPSTPQGKVDKQALVGQYNTLTIEYLNSTAQTSMNYSDHLWSDIELKFAKVLSDLLKVPLTQIGPDTSFFSLGIDSISAISYSRLLSKDVNCKVGISDILGSPSVVRLAERIASRNQVNEPTALVSTSEVEVYFDKGFIESTMDDFKHAGKTALKIMPCTPLQEAMLSAAESSSKQLYSNHVILNIIGNIERLKSCWAEMVRRHEILRTCFVKTDMRQYPYAQVILESFDPGFGYIDQELLETSQIIEEVSKRSGRDDLEPPYSLNIISQEDSIKLLISMHHALYDGAALTVLYEEVERLYSHQPLPPPVSFEPFLKVIRSTDIENADQFWETVLKGCPFALHQGIQRQPKNDEHAMSGTRIHRIHAKRPLSWIESRAKKHETSLLAIFQTLWATILSSRLQETDICFGNVVSGRTVSVEGIERLVAPCFNTIPARLQDIHKLSYLESFRILQNLNANSFPFQFTPLRRIQSKYSANGSRIFDTLFILQQSSRDLDSSIWSISEDNGVMDFPLVCEVIPRHSDDTLEIILHSYDSAISPREAGLLLKELATNLEFALQNPRHQVLSWESKDEILANIAIKEQLKTGNFNDDRTSKEMTIKESKIGGIIASFSDVPLERIGKYTSIFRLGLDSISTVQVASQLRKQGYSVLASDIMANPTISQLSYYLENNHGSDVYGDTDYDFGSFDKIHRGSICSKYGVRLEEVESIRPCTSVQQGMIAQSLYSAGNDYINSMWLELQPGISLQKFKAAWNEACMVHEMLRTGFAPTEDTTHPFAMITYSKDSFLLPWSEDINGSQSQDALPGRLLRRPWYLTVIEEQSKILVRFTAHHALYDAQSIKIILSSVARFYNSGSCPRSPCINSQLGAILRMSEDNIKSKQSFWQSEENKIVVNRFPDLTPLRVLEPSNSVLEISSGATTSELEANCRENDVTMQAAGQAAWARLLAAYIGESSTTFGVTLSGRSFHEDDGRVSFPSVITLPVRCNVTGRNAELLTRTMETNAQLLRYQFTPLTSIQKWAGYPEGKIFDTLFAYQKLPKDDEEAVLPWKVVREEASVDYTVSLEVQPEKTGKLTLRLSFKEDVIPTEQAQLILRQYDFLLQDTLRNPQGICDIAPCASKDILSITPATEKDLPSLVLLLHEFVEVGAKQWPDRKALEFTSRLESDNSGVQCWNYRQLNSQGNKVAQLLLDRGVIPGEIIAICFDKCAEASFAIVGILKAGCAYVALDPNAPADRLKFIVEDSGAKLILSSGKPVTSIKASIDQEIISLDSTDVLEAFVPERPKLSREISPQDTCYCLYTSGTTGTPKGCLITHENSVQAMLSFQRLFAGHWTEDSKWLQFASFHFDVSVLEQFWSWSVGICVASAPRDLIFEDIPRAIQQLGITHIDLTPSLARLLHPNEVRSLCKGVFITGGEQLKQEILDVWGEHACIYNGYGPTEATIGVTMFPRVPQNGKPSNIGPQFDNVGSYVVKPGTALPVLRGGVGELCVSGKLVGKGYLNRPNLTEERFPILKPFGERVYRTGDLVRILYDGSFIFLGRADDQIKLRGQRLELGEINEVAKKSSPALQEVVTLVLKHNAHAKEQLVTFFISHQADDTAQNSSLISTIRGACKSRLPGYMVPTHFIPIKTLPLNPNNKADTKQLAAMYNKFTIDDLQQLSHSSKSNRQWTKDEAWVISIVAKILDLESSLLTPSSNIFELGLDSISLIGFARNLQKSGLHEAKPSVVRKNPSIDGLVRVLLEGQTTDQCKENAYIAASQHITAFFHKHITMICNELEVENAEIETIAPCTPVQEGMIYRFLESSKPLYFHSFKFRLHAEVDTGKLLDAWSRIVSQLQILRTKFVATDDGYAQVALKQLDNSRQNLLIEYETAEKSAALKNPLKLNMKSNVLVLEIFHGIYDGNSLAMLLRHFVDEFNGVGEIDYGPSFHASLASGPLAKIPGAEEFWRKHLENWSYRPLPKISTSGEDIVATNIVEVDGFEELRKNMSVTPQALVQGIWLSVLQQMASPDLTIGIITSGRAIDFDGADNIVGPLFNTIPFHVNIKSGMTSASLVALCHEFNMQMQDFQHTPLKDIQKWCLAKPGQSLFDTLFVFQRFEIDESAYAKDLWTQIDDDHTADYPLAFEATLDSSRLSMTIVAQGSVITQSQADDLLKQMEVILHTTLRGSGNDPVVLSFYNTNSIKDPDQYSKVNGDEAIHDAAFRWTDSTDKMRIEIATLANVDESKIQENSSIFELGLDSIDVIKLSSRLKKKGIEIPVSVIIRSQTIAKMTAKISAPSRSMLSYEPTVSKRVESMGRELTNYLEGGNKLPQDVETVLPATPLQQTMVNEMIKSDYQRYFNVEAFELRKNVDEQKLMRAVEYVICQTPILRTTFEEIGDPKSPVSFAQVVRHHNPESLASIQALDENETVEGFVVRFSKLAARQAAAQKALCQVQYISIKRSRYIVMAISHALYDGRSLRAIHEDIQRAYHGNSISRPNFMPFLEQVFESTTDEAKNFWKATLSNLPPALFPRKDDSQEFDTKAVYRFDKRSRIPLKDIETLCKSSRITFQTVGQSCWALALAHLMGQLDVVFGLVLSCRDSEESGEVLFPLMNTIAVRSVIHGTLRDMLKYMQEMSDTTRQYQHFPLGMAQAFALASRETSFSSNDITLFDTLFIYQGRRPSPKDEPLYESVHGSAEVEFPVCVEMEIVDDTYLSWTTACKSIARTSTETELIIEVLDTILECIIAAPDTQAVSSDTEGISVCGLPKFKTSEMRTKGQPHFSKPIQREWSTTELNIRKVLHEVSNVPEDAINLDSTIFHLGLDSILVLKLPALLRRYGIRLTVSDILRALTISSMAQSAHQANGEQQHALDVDKILKNAVSSLNIASLETCKAEKGMDGIQYVMPVTAGQLYMIRRWQESHGALFYQTFTYDIFYPLSKEKLDEAWKVLLLRHDILRTGFVELESSMAQVVFKDPPNEVLDSEDGANSASLIQQSRSTLQWPPVNLIIERLENSKFRLKLVIHHALYDGISIGILTEELRALYHGQDVAATELSFRKFVAQSILVKGDNSSQQKWISYLNSSETLFCTKNTKSNPDTKRTEVFHPTLGISPPKKQAQEIGVSVDALLLASISKVYAQSLFLNSPHVIFGIYLANRAPFDEDLSHLSSPTLNLLPLCVKSPMDKTIAELAKAIQRDLQEISGKEMVGASLEEIYNWTGVRINLFVNILKGFEAPKSHDRCWRGVQDLTTRAEIVSGVANEEIKKPNSKAYLPSVDIELRYQDGTGIDMGVFGPEHMISVADAEGMIAKFTRMWN
ncbi:hypothetical protein B7494_g92 [Chlorociboria aeruginascens]|nr:hypothetical protein B7494_g92 [Chlorociboria aeruginascens]